jgi:hypothetical protein
VTGWGLDTLFNPSKRHMDEEKRRLQATREEVGDNSGGERIDLGTGKVVIKRHAKGEDEAEMTTEGETDQVAAEPEADTEPDTAAARARRRRRAARKT